MIILRYSYDNVWTVENILIVQADHLIFYEYCELSVNKSKNYEFWMTLPTAYCKEK